MSGFRKPETPREQLVLWEHRLDDAIPLDHPVRQVEYLLSSKAFAQTFGELERHYVLVEGKPPYYPGDLAGLYVYGMLNGIRSSRQLENACYNRLDVIWLMQGQHPDHSTIADFVKTHGRHLKSIFRDVLQVATRAGLIQLGHVAVDGTKIEADAGKKSVRQEQSLAEELATLDEQIAALEREWETNEARETNLFGQEVPWSPPGSLSDKQRLAAMKRKQERLERCLSAIERRRQGCASTTKPKAIASTTDPDSRVMRDKEGRRKPNYNGQVATDTEHGVIVATEVNDAVEDSGQLTPVLGEVAANCGRLPDEVSADSQYNTGPDLEVLETKGVVGYLPDARTNSEVPQATSPAVRAVEKSHRGELLSDEEWSALPKDNKLISKVAFRYDAEGDVYVCPAGARLRFVRCTQNRRNWGVARSRQYGGCRACATCVRATLCCKEPPKGRTIKRDQYEVYRERMRSRMKEERSRARYALRKQTVEPRIGEIKHVRGVRRFLRRGLEAVRHEWTLVCTAVNVGILLKHWEEVAAVL
jgi:transposase